jgi:aminomethyltransferase
MTPDSPLKRTPLYSLHQRLGARLVEFGGWEMPVQYTGIVAEHLAVRRAAGLFDISHMGELFFSGPGALDFLNATLTNDLRLCEVGRGQYTLLCNEDGGVVDDLYVYHLEPLGYLMIVNASRIVEDVAWLQDRLASWPAHQLVSFVNASDRRGAIAVQGPRVVEFIDRCFPGPARSGKPVTRLTELKKNEVAAFPVGQDAVWVARTGYTGEDGFEIVAPPELLEPIWLQLMEAGQNSGIQPCGLGARDTLRTEMCYPLYGHELDEHTSPLEAGLGSFVALEKGDFVGRSALAAQKTEGVRKRSVAFKMATASPPPRPHYAILKEGASARIGEVVSGTQSPSLGIGIGLGYVPPEFAKPGTNVQIEIRGNLYPAVVAPKPLYRKPG